MPRRTALAESVSRPVVPVDHMGQLTHPHRSSYPNELVYREMLFVERDGALCGSSEWQSSLPLPFQHSSQAPRLYPGITGQNSWNTAMLHQKTMALNVGGAYGGSAHGDPYSLNPTPPPLNFQHQMGSYSSGWGPVIEASQYSTPGLSVEKRHPTQQDSISKALTATRERSMHSSTSNENPEGRPSDTTDYNRNESRAKSKPFRCECGRRYGRQSTFDVHFKKWVLDDPLQCHECLRPFPNVAKLQEHINCEKLNKRHTGASEGQEVR